RVSSSKAARAWMRARTRTLFRSTRPPTATASRERSTMQGVLMLSRVTVRDADFRRVTFDQFAPEGCTFERCDFSLQTLDRRYQPLFSSRKQSVFRDCNFDGADLTAVRPGQARFERCSFDGAKLDGWESFTAEFVDCRFAGIVRNVRFYGKPWGASAAK